MVHFKSGMHPVPVANSTIEPLLMGLDAGEFQAILLARELQVDWLLIDQRGVTIANNFDHNRQEETREANLA